MRIYLSASAIMLLVSAFSRTPTCLSFSISTRGISHALSTNVISSKLNPHTGSSLFAKQTETETRTYTQESISGYKAPTVNWYPGHIAKAERTLSETLTSADVLVEVRDARIPKATAHPKVREWTAGKPRIVVMTHSDTVPGTSIKSWSNALNNLGAGRWDGKVADGNVRHQANQAMKKRGLVGEDGQVEDVIYVDAKRGAGTPALLRAIGRSGAYVNDRRKKRGLRDRPLRVAILGYPNVGKSALINRILGRRRAKSANTPGITRALQWIRVKGNMDGTDETGKTRKTKSNKRINGDFELLDSPGIIPANMENQEDAILLAVCNSIGNAAYDNQGVAAYLCERLKTLYEMKVEGLTAPQWRQKSIDRYKFDPLEPMVIPSLSDEIKTRIPTGEDMLYAVAEKTCYGDPENAARKILQDFRNGRMGPACLQLAPKEKDDSIDGGEKKVAVLREVAVAGEGVLRIGSGEITEENDKEREARARNAMRAAEEQGLELPTMEDETNEQNEEDVGKGMFDGW